MTSSLPSHVDVEAALARCGADAGAALSHGALAGLLCARPEVTIPEWLAEALGVEAEQANEAVEAEGVFEELRVSTLEQLQDTGMSFQLLLPDDSVALEQRAAALGHWCEGFLLGLGLGGVRQDSELDEEVREYLQDISEIAKVEAETASGETEEHAYTEVLEYVRMGAMLTCIELRHRASSGATSPRLQ